MELETRNQISDDYDQVFYATMCHVCKQFGEGIHLKNCGGCRMIAYCGQQHQRLDWKQHRPLCKAIQDVMQNHSVDNLVATMSSLGVTMEHWDKKVNFAQSVSDTLGRRLTYEELQVICFRRECLVCHEQNAQLLEDCQKCASSFCKGHKDGHKDICATLELCLRADLLAVRGRSGPQDLSSYLKHVSYTGTFQNTRDFINAFGDIRIASEMSHNVLTADHSEYLTHPLTLFHAMRLLNYVPKSNKDLVIHLIGATDADEGTSMGWEIFPRLINVMSVVVIMIGPELTRLLNPSHICDNCMSREKKCLTYEFHDVLYENYVRSPLFVKPDLVVKFSIHVRELVFTYETWAPSVRVLAKQNCPFVLTCATLLEFQNQTDKINTILKKKVNYLYSGKNPFAGISPYRNIGPEYLAYTNQYLIIYRNLCS